ncbi:uncharacterized protein LOC122016099 [Zingiber officinale]|uniref:uncharacterized protein LOC122016099 n=1 Tax=Zingiber officinale TaxID=94328 RepID=UPI001C4AA068|nr:uncharacterized protein LOC122016099 [Zingiber officinale]
MDSSQLPDLPLLFLYIVALSSPSLPNPTLPAFDSPAADLSLLRLRLLVLRPSWRIRRLRSEEFPMLPLLPSTRHGCLPFPWNLRCLRSVESPMFTLLPSTRHGCASSLSPPAAAPMVTLASTRTGETMDSVARRTLADLVPSPWSIGRIRRSGWRGTRVASLTLKLLPLVNIPWR